MTLRTTIIPDDINSEICEAIITSPQFGEAEAMETLIGLSLVSRSWCYASRRHLVRSLNIETSERLYTLLRLLKKPGNTLARHIRRMKVGVVSVSRINADGRTWLDDQMDARVLTSLIPNLIDIQLESIDRPTIRQHRFLRGLEKSLELFPTNHTVTTLSLRTDFFDGTYALYRFLSNFACLKCLTLNGIHPRLLSTLPEYLSTTVEYLRLRQEDYITTLRVKPSEDDLSALPIFKPKLRQIFYDNLTPLLIHPALECMLLLAGEVEVLEIRLPGLVGCLDGYEEEMYDDPSDGEIHEDVAKIYPEALGRFLAGIKGKVVIWRGTEVVWSAGEGTQVMWWDDCDYNDSVPSHDSGWGRSWGWYYGHDVTDMSYIAEMSYLADGDNLADSTISEVTDSDSEHDSSKDSVSEWLDGE